MRRNIKNLIVLISPVVVFCAKLSHAATYYVSPAGNDANPGTLDAPWRTVQKAANTLLAGQTALIRGGTYTESNITFANSGASGAPITLKAYPAETPVVTGGFTVAGSCINNCSVFWIDGQNYITLDGLEISQGVMSNVRIAYNNVTTGVVIQNCNLHHVVTRDNVGIIYLDSSGAVGSLIQNNRIHDVIVDPASSPLQGDGIKIFRGDQHTIQNNEIYNLVDGIYYKHSNGEPLTAIVKNNYIHDLDSSVGRGIWWSSHDALISNNLVANSFRGIALFEDGGTCGALNNTLSHNTTVTSIGIDLESNQGGSCTYGAFGTHLENNVVANVTNGEYRGIAVWKYNATVDGSNSTLAHNLVDNTTLAAPIAVLSSYYTIAQINAGIPATLTANHNIAGNASFVNAAGGNYTLAPGSLGHLAAGDGTDMGAQICAVGVNASCSANTVSGPPARPIGLVLK